MKRKTLVVMLGAILTLTACGADKPAESDAKERVYQIGLTQFAQHGSLDNCREGFLEGLAEEGFVEGKNLRVDYQNANADMGTAAQIAENFVARKVDLIAAIATPSAMHAYNAAKAEGRPVIYTAVTDPQAAGLADGEGMPVGEVSGTSDALPIEAQLKMIREVLPKAKRIGILYTTSEANSISSIEKYKELALSYGFEIQAEGVQSTAEIPLAIDHLLAAVDCVSNLTDNTVVNSLPLLLNRAKEKGIPVFGSEVEQVAMGCLASEGLDYIQIGKDTGKMAAQVLRGEKKASEMAFQQTSEPYLCLNTAVAETLGLSFSETLQARAAEIFTSVQAPKGE